MENWINNCKIIYLLHKAHIWRLPAVEGDQEAFQVFGGKTVLWEVFSSFACCGGHLAFRICKL